MSTTFMQCAALVALLIASNDLIAGPQLCRTVTVRGLAPLPDPRKVKVVEELGKVSQPYQVIGKATLWNERGRVGRSSAIDVFRIQAAEMGADGVIGVQGYMGLYNVENPDSLPRGMMQSALMVKWLEAGESPKPISVPFIIGVLPVAEDTNARGDHQKVTRLLRTWLNNPLERKGYYFWPGWVDGFSGSLEDAQKMDLEKRQALGGKPVHLLLEIKLISESKSQKVVAAISKTTVRTRLLDKRTGEICFDNMGSGSLNTFKSAVGAVGLPGPGLVLASSFIAPSAQRAEAALRAILQSLSQLKPAGEVTTP